MKTLHIDTEKTWRGGENQMSLLVDGLSSIGINCWIALRKGSAAEKKLCHKNKLLPLSFSGLGIFYSIIVLIIFCHRNRIDIIDAHTSRAHDISLIIKSFCPWVRLVIHRRVDYVPKSSRRAQRKYLNNKIDRFIAISHSIRNILVEWGVPKTKIDVARSAVCSARFNRLRKTECLTKIHDELPQLKQKKIIISVGYMTTQKGHDTLIKAINEIKNTSTPFHCLIAGDGELRQNIEKMIDSYHLENYVTLLGVRNDIPELLTAADILSMPSNYEGLGTTILDALNGDCCVVASRVGGIPEMIEHGVTGLLSDPKDFKAHAANLNKALQNPEWAQKLAEAGRKKIKQDFSVEKMVQQNLMVYQNCLAE